MVNVDHQVTRVLPALTYKAPLTVRGYVTFYNIRPDKKTPQFWMCDGCAERVPKSRHEEHINKRHGWYADVDRNWKCND